MDPPPTLSHRPFPPDFSPKPQGGSRRSPEWVRLVPEEFGTSFGLGSAPSGRDGPDSGPLRAGSGLSEAVPLLTVRVLSESSRGDSGPSGALRAHVRLPPGSGRFPLARDPPGSGVPGTVRVSPERFGVPSGSSGVPGRFGCSRTVRVFPERFGCSRFGSPQAVRVFPLRFGCPRSGFGPRRVTPGGAPGAWPGV